MAKTDVLETHGQVKTTMKRPQLIFSCLGHAYMHLFTSFYFVIVLSLEEAWQLPYHELLELWTLGALLVGAAALPAGWLSDRWSAPAMMGIYFIGLGLSAIACALADEKTALFLGLSAIGLFAAIYHPVGIPWLVRNAKEKGKALGINGIFGGIGVASGGLVAGGLIDLFGWRAAFLVPGLLVLCTGIFFVGGYALGWMQDPERQAADDAPRGRGSMMRPVLVLLLTLCLMGLVFNATQSAIPKVFDLRLRALAGEGAFGIGAIVALVYGLGALVQYFGGVLADRYPLKPLYLLAFLIQVPVLSLVALLSGLPLIFVSMVTVALASAALPAENMLLARYTPERRHGLIFGLKFVLSFGVAPLAILLVSKIQAATGELTWLFFCLGAAAALAFALCLLLPGTLRMTRQVARA